MRVRFGLVAVIVCLGSVIAIGEEAPALDSQLQKTSYVIGLELGRNFKKGEIEVDLDILRKGITDGLSGTEPLMSVEQIGEAMNAFQAEMVRKGKERQKELAGKNQGKGEAFLAENKEKEGVVTLESGLQYKVLEEGNGEMPKKDDMVKVNYVGTLIDGTEFDSSYKRGQAAEFGVGKVIAGWTEALQLMKVGSKWELYIPSDLAYGTKGTRGMIGPNETLIFEVELLEIVGK